MKVHDVWRGNMGKIVADLDVSSAKKVVEAKRGEMVNIGADLAASSDTHISRQNKDNYAFLSQKPIFLGVSERKKELGMVRVHGVKEDLGLESIAGEDESCLLLISTSEQLQSLN
ncbi:hypothetical protein H0E87_023693, partial [Populus deltoides]